MPHHAEVAPDSWIITDGRFRFTFADVSAVATMPGAFVSRSRLTRDFPCLRVTQHLKLAPDMTIHALRVIGYTDKEPPKFPLRYSNKEDEK
jgi:hypothetical protein